MPDAPARCANSYYGACRGDREYKGLFCGQKCAAEWAVEELTNGFDREEFDWCTACGSLVWDPKYSPCPECEDEAWRKEKGLA
jgi:hypothetical protein